ncbi:MAG: ACT domain-containing protein [Candidatus Lokiarchaeota archaeon]|nr:ACT domain-containing protein [Candidatus Lokiarchaeota archaeon]
MKKDKSEISIAEASRTVIQSKPAVLNAMTNGIVNYSALANMILDEVLELVNREKVHIDAIKMALMRYSEEIKDRKLKFDEKIANVLIHSKLQLKNELIYFSVSKRAVIDSNILKLISDYDVYFQLIEGTNSFTILADVELKDKIIEILNEKNILLMNEDQSGLILISPSEIIDVPGIISYVTDLYAMANINITHLMSCYTDTIFVINRKDATKAFELLEDRILILRNLKNIKNKK